MEDWLKSLKEFPYEPIPEEDIISSPNGPLSQDIKDAISAAKKGKPSVFKGKSHTEQSLAKMRASLPDRRGDNNSRARKWRLTYHNGSTMSFYSLHTWAKERHLHPNSIRNVYYGKSNNYKGIVKVERL